MPPNHDRTLVLRDRNVYTRWSAPSKRPYATYGARRRIRARIQRTNRHRTHTINRKTKERDAKLRYVHGKFTLEWGPQPYSAVIRLTPKTFTLNETSTTRTAHTSRIRTNDLLSTPQYEDEAVTSTTKLRRPKNTPDSGSKKDTNENRTPAIERLTNTTTRGRIR